MKIHSTSYGMPCEEGKPSSDAFAVRSWNETLIAVLADGAGTGEPAREAAQRAVDAFITNYEAKPRAWTPQHALAEFTRLINRTLHQESMARFERVEMVSTLAAAVIEGDRLYGVNVGDSRICLLREGSVSQLSNDHVDEARTNVLNRALGMEATIEPHLFEFDLRDGDVAMLCSDGVSNHLSETHIATALRERSSARFVVKAAHERATSETLDDMSAIVLDIAQVGRLKTLSERNLSIPAVLKRGQLVDGYELLRAFQDTDRVWLAEKDGVRVVLKFAPLEAIDSEAHLNAFIRESWNATRIEAPCLVRAHEPPGQTMRYYVMEFVDAPSLAAVMQARRLSVDSAIALGKFLAEASQLLLRRDLVHGDIKPENILCVGDYAQLSFKLVDLGSSAEIFSVTSRAGTPSYLAPERFHGAPVSERTEIFAIGVTLFQSLAGALPYGSIERFQTPVHGAPKRPGGLNPNIPPWLEAVILRAVARKPGERYQHYSEFAYDLTHPDQVEPFHDAGASLLDRNPLLFYKAGFFTLLAVTVVLLIRLLSSH